MPEITCFKCGNRGHMARDCDDQNYAAEIGDGDKPMWCGMCDRDTRLVFHVRDGREAARRCGTCNPSGHLLAVQFKRCKDCKAVIYIWDSRTECGNHPPVGRHLEVQGKAQTKGKAA